MLTVIGAGPRPCLELAVGFDEGAKHLSDERSRLDRIAVNVLVIARVTLERGFQLACKRDADLHRTEWFGDATEFHNDLRAPG